MASFLLVTEKLNNRIDAFHVQLDGTLGPIVVTAAVGPGTFAVVFAPNGAALVSETGPAGGNNASAISSYAALPNGILSPLARAYRLKVRPLAGRRSLLTGVSCIPPTPPHLPSLDLRSVPMGR